MVEMFMSVISLSSDRKRLREIVLKTSC